MPPSGGKKADGRGKKQEASADGGYQFLTRGGGGGGSLGEGGGRDDVVELNCFSCGCGGIGEGGGRRGGEGRRERGMVPSSITQLADYFTVKGRGER